MYPKVEKIGSINAELVRTECKGMKKEQKWESSLLLLPFCTFSFNICYHFVAVTGDISRKKSDFGKKFSS